MAKDPKPENSRATGGASRGGSGAGSQRVPGKGSGGRGRTRPPANVVTKQKPWGLIAAAVAVVVFAAAVISYAVVQVNESNANRVTEASQIAGLETFEYAAGQEHVTTPVSYTENPPVGGPHDGEWADCTGTVYDVDIRHENAVHSMEHGATWITYDPELITDGDLATLEELVEGTSGLMLSPYVGLGSPISLQSWNHQLTVDSADDMRVQQYADFMTYNADFYPEVGASCENPLFITDPVVEDGSSRGTDAMVTDAPTTSTPAPETTSTP
ncbi:MULTISPECIES: DUF3105 domain-containing protein [unclassified Modestobacter]|uniref:DUF3105 domain-containing protein n=1 Tax=unclassified Modestobacter TaxID=2643866 RepID=UPI0022AACDD9|nr:MULTISPECIES: DUF3105 domain-containing protein [unclassified Modestobacter]MCZ2823938.1 DUF3105 domain-containing protein [Modestobacter sp. VKM Ac-2981]MCZ2852183.1 DUF3105 domain-containing protein [Modestobacter sp. VKM Ac-2982]